MIILRIYLNDAFASFNYTNKLFCLFRINPKDNSLDVSYEEWRNYLLFHPSTDISEIMDSWRINTVRLTYIILNLLIFRKNWLMIHCLFI